MHQMSVVFFVLSHELKVSKMCSQTSWKLGTQFLCFLFALLLSLPVGTAKGIYDYVPEDAYGFVTINNLDELNSKTKTFSELFRIPMPTPLDFLKISTGLDEGLDKSGSAVLAALPTDISEQTMEPMLLLPVEDYAKFANSLSGDPSGGICRVALAGNDVLLAKKDDYALLMDVTSQEIMEIILSAQASEVAALKAMSPWLRGNDLNFIIMPNGLEFMHSKGSEALAEQKQKMGGTIWRQPDSRKHANKHEYVPIGFRLLRSRSKTRLLGVENRRRIEPLHRETDNSSQGWPS